MHRLPVTSVFKHLPTFMPAILISVTPSSLTQEIALSDDVPATAEKGSDSVITKALLENAMDSVLKKTDTLLTMRHVNACIIRTLPNSDEKKHHTYTSTNPPYLTRAAAQYLAQHVSHVLVDLPSVDREDDGGALQAHRAIFSWTPDLEERIKAIVDADMKDLIPQSPDIMLGPDSGYRPASITELCYIPDSVHDGLYLLDLHIGNIQSDASPSRPLLYHLI